MRLALLIAALVALVSAQVGAATYHVQKTGSDAAAGTAVAPFQHIWKGLSVAVAGDTVCVDDATATYDGTFEDGQPGGSGNQQVVRFLTSGTAGNTIRLSTLAAHGCAGGLVTVTRLNGPGGVVLYYGISIEANYIELHGFHVYGGSDQAAAIINAEHSTSYPDGLTACVAHDADFICNGTGIGIYGHHLTLGYNETSFHGKSGVDGTPLNIGGGNPETASLDYITVDHLITHNNANYSPAGGSGLSMVYMADFDAGAGMTCPGDSSGNLYRVCVTNLWTYNNREWVIEINTGGRIADGNGCIFGPQDPTNGYTGKILLLNSIIANNGGSGCHIFMVPYFDVINSTAWKNMQTSNVESGHAVPCTTCGEFGFFDFTTGRVINSIMVSKDGTNNYLIGTNGSGTLTCDHNVRVSGAGAGCTGTGDLTSDPLLNAPSGDGAGNFRLLVGSPAIGAANSALSSTPDFYGTARPQGASWDIGAAQYLTPLSSTIMSLPAILH